MNSFLIVSDDKPKREEYAQLRCKELGIADADITIISRETGEKKDSKKIVQSIGIEQIKLMQGKLYLKPIKSPFKAVLIHDAHLLTTEAQNALLKVLEEPPQQTDIMLTAENRDALLPTILSRCTVIGLGIQKAVTEQERADYNQMLALIRDISIGDGLKLAESLSKSKDDTILWLEKMTLVSREKMLDDYDYAFIVESLQKTHTLLKTTNVNPRIALEYLFLCITFRSAPVHPNLPFDR